MEHTETLIVEQLKIGNEDAYQYIYDRHYALPVSYTHLRAHET